MRALVVSDLHLDHYYDGGGRVLSKLPKDVDVAIIAGDLSTSAFLSGALKQVSRLWKEVIFVPGNHDHYGGTLEQVQEVMSKAPENVHCLDRDFVVVGGQRFVGCALWFPDSPAARSHTDCLNDFYQIRDFRSWIWDRCKKDRVWLVETVCSSDVVVTHHLPSRRSVQERYKDNPVNCYFLASCEGLIKEAKPKLWIHGHTHDPCDYQLGETRVLCNPFGYPGERSDPEGLVIDIE